MKIRTSCRIVLAAVALAAGFAMQPIALGSRRTTSCSAARGRSAACIEFHASGYNIVNGVALPKAIIETLVFDGRGNVLTPAVSLSINGNIIQPPQGNPGVYTVDADCTGTLTFADGPMFNLHIAPYGKSVKMLQINPNTVMQGDRDRKSCRSAPGAADRRASASGLGTMRFPGPDVCAAMITRPKSGAIAVQPISGSYSTSTCQGRQHTGQSST